MCDAQDEGGKTRYAVVQSKQAQRNLEDHWDKLLIRRVDDILKDVARF